MKTTNARQRLSGIIPPVITPFLPDGFIDEAAFRRLAKHLIEGGIDAAFVAGTAGMGPQLTNRQFEALAALALDCFQDNMPVLGGVIECSTARALERIRILESLGYSYFVLTSTYFLPPKNSSELIAHFGRCAESTGMEMIVYNIPACTGIQIEPESIAHMAEQGWTRMVKDSSGDAAQMEALCALAPVYDLAVFQGLWPNMQELIRQGAAGCVPVPGNLRPDLFVKAWEAAKAHDATELSVRQDAINRLWSATVIPGDFLSGTLYALSKSGLLGESLPCPFRPASPRHRSAVDEALARIDSLP